MRNSGKALLGSLLRQRGMRTSNRFPCLLIPLLRGQACSFYGVRVGVCPGVGFKRWLRCFAHPFGGIVCRGHAPHPQLFLQFLQKVAVFLISLHLLGPKFPQPNHSYF